MPGSADSVFLRIRLHGRGGEGVKLASRIVGRAAFLAGHGVQDSPLYGAERRGAPVVASVRVAAGAVLERGYVGAPDVVVVMDDSLLDVPEAAVLDGVDAATALLVNTWRAPAELAGVARAAGTVVTHDVTATALRVIGRRVLSAPVAAMVVGATALASWSQLAEAVRVELCEAGVGDDAVAKSAAAARAVFDETPALRLARRGAAAPVAPAPAFRVPRVSARAGAPSITAPGTTARRTTEGWRVERPIVDRARCTRCFLCFALCPEGAIHLDAESYPVVDYQHCKGCLVCVTECPPDAIAAVPEPHHDA